MHQNSNYLRSTREITTIYNSKTSSKQVSHQTVHRHITKSLKYSKVQVKLKDVNTDTNSNYTVRANVAYVISEAITNKIPIISIDETGFDGRPKGLRGWKKVGKNSISVVKKRTKNHSLILAVDNRGFKYFETICGSMKRVNFITFLKNMIKLWKRTNEDDSISKAVLLMDNLSAHKGAEVESLVKVEGMTLLYNVPYLPEYNFVETVFSAIKKEFNKEVTVRNKRKIKESIAGSVRKISSNTIQKCYLNSIKFI